MPLIHGYTSSSFTREAKEQISMEDALKRMGVPLKGMISALAVCALFLSGPNDAAPTEVQRMTISKMRMADLETSASGYVYNQQQGLPASYMQYTNHGSGRYYRAPDTVHYVVGVPAAPVALAASQTAPRYEPTVIAYASDRSVAPYAKQEAHANEEIANYANEQLPKYATTFGDPKSEPLAPYYKDDESAPEVTKSDANDSSDEDDNDEDSEEDDDDEDDDEDEEENEGFSKDVEDDGEEGFEFPGKVAKGSDAPQADTSSSFEVGNGGKYAAEGYSEHKEKGDKGYKSRKEFSDGDKSTYDNGNQEGHYDIEGGHGKKYIDTAVNYGSKEDAEKHEKDSDYGHSSYHSKGHKTDGFHNIYHKDEFKKNTDFYDNAHKEGYFDKHEEHSNHHKTGEGEFKKGNSQSSGFDEKDSGKKGYYDKGHHDNHHQGHEAQDKESSYHENHADHDTEKKSNSANTSQFSTGFKHR